MKRAQAAIQRVTAVDKTMTALLGNILPKSVIPRLIASNYQFSKVTDRIPYAYCIFVDFFHDGYIRKFDAEVAAATLNETFSEFDEMLTDFPRLEKIKTISSKCMLMAIETTLLRRIQTHFSEAKRDLSIAMKVDIRIGVAYGSIVAGIVGKEKFIYDIYSDTVNCASRMANLDFASIACTAEAYRSYDPVTQSIWQSLGTHEVKGKGLMELYTLIDFADSLVELPTPRFSEIVHESREMKSQSGFQRSKRLSISKHRFSISPLQQDHAFARPLSSRRTTQMRHLWSPAVEFAKAAEDRGLPVFNYDGDGKNKSVRSSSKPSRLVEIGKLKSKITPLDTSKYLDSMSTITIDESDETCPALRNIIHTHYQVETWVFGSSA
ncbi:hypothetical protein HDU76_007680 [Blyttiomyces sp. JEL0837]|nr:hypothetical protein HDU76_007680 [Blyttiomyces sp. JEL0837]